MVLDRNVWLKTGALSLRRTADGFAVNAARPPGYDRPWSRAPATATATSTNASSPANRPATHDATPRADDLRPED
jgi:competence protein ComEC